MKKLLLIQTLLLISMVSANLIITPQPSDLTCKIGTVCTNQITLKNNYSFEVLDFNFEGLTEKGFIFPSIEIPANSSKTIDFTLNPTTSFHGNIQVPVSFRYEVSLPEEATTYYINISETGFLPNHIDIKQDDTIVWTNIDTISHTVTSALFDRELYSNETFSHTFNQVDTINYQDLNLFFGGTINILNKSTTEKANNPNYDIIWAINLNAVLNPTNLSMENSKTDYEVEYGKFKKGLLTIKNEGAETAELVNLNSNSDWISFNKNNINIEPGEEDWIEYTITPILFDTNATDKNYNLEIMVKASNSNELNQTITVFVPYKEVSNDLGGSDLDTLNWLTNVFCPKFPTSFLCNQSITSGNGSIVYQDLEIPINLSAKEFYESLRREQANTDAIARVSNKVTQAIDKYNEFFPQITNQMNQSVTMQEENEKKNKRFKNSMWIVGFFVVIIVSILSVINVVNKKSHKKDLMEGAYKYRK